jgi:hypothetical protein
VRPARNRRGRLWAQAIQVICEFDDAADAITSFAAKRDEAAAQQFDGAKGSLPFIGFDGIANQSANLTDQVSNAGITVGVHHSPPCILHHAVDTAVQQRINLYQSRAKITVGHD